MAKPLGSAVALNEAELFNADESASADRFATSRSLTYGLELTTEHCPLSPLPRSFTASRIMHRLPTECGTLFRRPVAACNSSYFLPEGTLLSVGGPKTVRVRVPSSAMVSTLTTLLGQAITMWLPLTAIFGVG